MHCTQWQVFVSSAFRVLRQKDREFELSLCYVMNPCTPKNKIEKNPEILDNIVLFASEINSLIRINKLLNTENGRECPSWMVNVVYKMTANPILNTDRDYNFKFKTKTTLWSSF